jgi:hypothetical protein
MSEIAHAVPAAAAPQKPAGDGAALISLIERMATNPDVDIDKFERLVSMKERIDQQAAQRAFNDAIASAKGEVGVIYKNRQVDFTTQKGRTNYKHEDFSSVARAVDPILAKHGLSYRFRSTQDKSVLTVTCVISHRDGYSEETTLQAAEDHSGNKNNIQAIGSAATYLQRYTLKLALGLASSDDDDARAASRGPTISPDQIEKLLAEFDATNANIARFCEHFQIDKYADLPAVKFDAAMALLKAKKDKSRG